MNDQVIWRILDAINSRDIDYAVRIIVESLHD